MPLVMKTHCPFRPGVTPYHYTQLYGQASDGSFNFVFSNPFPSTPVPLYIGPLVSHDLVHLSRDVAVYIRVLILCKPRGTPVRTERGFDDAVDGFFSFDRHCCADGGGLL